MKNWTDEKLAYDIWFFGFEQQGVDPLPSNEDVFKCVRIYRERNARG
jgi:hypothetical protein